jgi:hypothetical protein
MADPYRCTECGDVKELEPGEARPSCPSCAAPPSTWALVGSTTEFYRWLQRSDVCRIGAHRAESPVDEYTFVAVGAKDPPPEGYVQLSEVKINCCSDHEPALDLWAAGEFPSFSRELSLGPSRSPLVRDFLALRDANLLGESFGSERELVLQQSGELLVVSHELQRSADGRPKDAQLRSAWLLAPAQLQALKSALSTAKARELAAQEPADTLGATLTFFEPVFHRVTLRRGVSGGNSGRPGFPDDAADYVYQLLRSLFFAATRAGIASFQPAPVPRANAPDPQGEPVLVVTSWSNTSDGGGTRIAVFATGAVVYGFMKLKGSGAEGFTPYTRGTLPKHELDAIASLAQDPAFDGRDHVEGHWESSLDGDEIFVVPSRSEIEVSREGRRTRTAFPTYEHDAQFAHVRAALRRLSDLVSKL